MTGSARTAAHKPILDLVFVSFDHGRFVSRPIYQHPHYGWDVCPLPWAS